MGNVDAVVALPSVFPSPARSPSRDILVAPSPVYYGASGMSWRLLNYFPPARSPSRDILGASRPSLYP